MAEVIHPFYESHRGVMEAAMRHRLDLAEAMLCERAHLSNIDGIRQEVMDEFDFIEPGLGDNVEFGINYKACGFCKFAACHEDQEILPNICGLDFDAHATRGIHLERTQTLAGGAGHCNFRFSRIP